MPPDRLSVVLVVGTRPEAIKLAPLALALRDQPGVKMSIWCTGQHAAWATEMLGYFDLAPDRVFDLAHQHGLSQIFSHMLTQLQAALLEEQPEVVVVQGDTSSAFAGALAASYAGSKVVHVEAGLRSSSRHMPFPEEAHRRAIANFTTLHCAPTETAKIALLDEGIAPYDVVEAGNTVIDALHLIQHYVPANDLFPVSGKKIVLLTCHRRESWGDPYKAVCSAALQIANRGDCEVVFVAHPNPELQAVAHDMLLGHSDIRLVPPLGYPDFMHLLGRATLVLTDSGGIQEEAAALGTPLLVLRENTERPEGIQAGTAQLVGTSKLAIVAAANKLLDDPRRLAAMRNPCTQYGDGNAAHRITEAILARFLPLEDEMPQIRAVAALTGSSLLA